MLLVVRNLEQEEYGLFAIIQSSILTVGFFAGLGLGSTVTRYVGMLKIRNQDELGSLLKLTNRIAVAGSLVMALLVFLGGDEIAISVLNQPEVGALLSLASLAILANALYSYCNSALVGFEKTRESAIAQVAATVITTPILVLLSYMNGITGAVWGMILQSFTLFLFTGFFYLRILQNLKYEKYATIGKREWKVIRSFTIPAFLSGFAAAPVHLVCQTILINAKNGTSEMAIIGIAMQWFYALIYIPTVAGRILIPTLAEMHSLGKTESRKKMMYYAVAANASFVIPISFVLFFLREFFMEAYGQEYAKSTSEFSLAIAAAILACLVVPMGQSIMATGRAKLTLALNLCWALVYIFLTMFWIENGAAGLLCALVVAYLVLLSSVTYCASMITPTRFHVD